MSPRIPCPVCSRPMRATSTTCITCTRTVDRALLRCSDCEGKKNKTSIRCRRCRLSRTPAQRFGNRYSVQPNGCWVWTGALDGDGYGMVSMGSGKDRGAHRVSWEIHRGPIPAGLHVLHHCDNPPCVNPDHLFPGTQADNVADMVRKDRGQKGERSAASKLTTSQVRSIRSDSRSQKDIARAFGVDQSTISEIKTGKTWSHVA